MSQIVPGVYVSNHDNAMNDVVRAHYRLRAIVNCTRDMPFTSSTDVKKLRVPIDDNADQNELLYANIDTATSFIHAHRPVLVHCYVGVSRSPSVVALYLIRYYHVSMVVAIGRIRAVRPFAFSHGKVVRFRQTLQVLDEQEQQVCALLE